jgi:hypothetical protein
MTHMADSSEGATQQGGSNARTYFACGPARGKHTSDAASRGVSIGWEVVATKPAGAAAAGGGAGAPGIGDRYSASRRSVSSANDSLVSKRTAKAAAAEFRAGAGGGCCCDDAAAAAGAVADLGVKRTRKRTVVCRNLPAASMSVARSIMRPDRSIPTTALVCAARSGAGIASSCWSSAS